QSEVGPGVVRAPREPAPKQIDAHEATYIPHAAWCETCMAGSGRNKPHRRKASGPAPEGQQEWLSDTTGSGRAPDADGASDEPEAEGILPTGLVPCVCMDYFYVSSRPTGRLVGAQGMSTNELQQRQWGLGKSSVGSRDVLMNMYHMYSDKADQEELETGLGPGIHAHERPMMVMADEFTGNKYMRAVRRKGLGDDGDTSWLVKDMHQELKSWGHPGGVANAIIMNSDAEPAIVPVREALARCHGGRVTSEQPPPGEHQSNGLAEATGRHVRYQSRAVKLQLQCRIGCKVADDEPVMPWLLRWAAMSMPRFQKGRDGRTPYQRQRGRKCELEVIPFGDVVMYRMSEVASDRHHAREERWGKGVWLGHAQHTPEVIISTESGIVKAYAVRRLPRGQPWDGEMIGGIKGSPTNWKLDATEEPEMVECEDQGEIGLDTRIENRVGSRTGVRRAMYLSRKDFIEYGYTDGCTGCRDVASGKKGQIAPHTAACQRRMEEAVRERDLDRWEGFFLRRRQGEVAQEKAERPADPEAREVEDEQGSLFGGWGHLDVEEDASLELSSALSGDLGLATPLAAEASKVARERERESNPGRSKEATRRGLETLKEIWWNTCVRWICVRCSHLPG
ncbi:hypothetical protein N9L68_05500, partial [bacterium]|nr:hypothetical protein [bacterium]